MTVYPNFQIEDLVEQLEQFREEIVNKEEEISQLQLQLEVAGREKDSGTEDFTEQLQDALQENAQLKVSTLLVNMLVVY